ncbi:NAD(P)/FAD-dependent oxidoreductase [Streptomyces sp. NPDC048290]|uniref:NAD(P)/FAD-dependent oxidoreductase n=1 Tax=Streptomyces sp. NPDC048290 TaxID=3155811 RepID=UPI003426B65D
MTDTFETPADPRTDRPGPPDLARPYEVIVVGGGAAGLSAALVLGRARRRTLVVDAGEPRNAPSPHMQGYLTRDGMPPAEFLALGRAEVAHYDDVDQLKDRAVDITRNDGPTTGTRNHGATTGTATATATGFTVTLESGRTASARRLIITTGLKDQLPPLPGLAARFGKDVLHCPYCHGWEVRDRAFGVLATSALSVHQALMVTQWSPDVTFFLHTVDETELSDQDLRRLAAAGVKVVPGEVAEVLTADDGPTGVRLTGVRLADGTVHDREVLFTAPRPVPRTGLLERLGARLTETPFGAYAEVDPTGLTSVPGVYAAGNAMGFGEQVPHAVSGGYRAAAALNGELLMTDLDTKITT